MVHLEAVPPQGCRRRTTVQCAKRCEGWSAVATCSATLRRRVRCSHAVSGARPTWPQRSRSRVVVDAVNTRARRGSPMPHSWTRPAGWLRGQSRSLGGPVRKSWARRRSRVCTRHCPGGRQCRAAPTTRSSNSSSVVSPLGARIRMRPRPCASRMIDPYALFRTTSPSSRGRRKS